MVVGPKHHTSWRVMSLDSAGNVKRGHSVLCMANLLVAKLAAAGHHFDKPFDAPFDKRGRCNHHSSVQMAIKEVRSG